MPNIKVVILDFDGVLCHTADQHFQFFTDMMETYERKTDFVLRDFDHAKSLFGATHAGFLEQLGFDTETIAIIWRKYEREFAQRYPFEYYPGIRDFLIAIHESDIILAVASANCLNNVEAGIHNERSLFSHIFTRDNFPGPKPEMLKEIIKREGIDKEEAVFAGDMKTDLIAAQQVGIPFVAAAYGWDDFSDVPDIPKAHSVQELHTFITSR